MARVPEVVRKEVERRYEREMANIENQKEWVKRNREALADAEKELAKSESLAEDLADWLRNNPS